ncbi:MAG: phosphatase PAP2 family protein [Candidatus Pacearchaeota archaeon]|nr:MAG: phosphatase PAP2 family protein [Candidatus Pacearchaeota archaeon]
MKKEAKTIIFFIIAIIVFIVSLMLDNQIFFLIQSIRNPVMDTFFSWLLFIEDAFIYYPLVILSTFGIVFWKKRKNILPFTITFLISLILILLLKNIILRPRPFLPGSQDSFPSGHPLIFTILPFLDYKKEKYLKIIWLIISCLIIFTRIWFGLHYLSDVVTGIMIIYIVAFIIKNSWKKLKIQKTKTKKKKKR